MINSVVMIHSVVCFSVLLGWLLYLRFLTVVVVVLTLFGGWCSLVVALRISCLGVWF